MQSPADPYDLVRGLRVVRRYRPDPIDGDDLAAILEAGRWTGSSKNRQDWAFVAVTDRGVIADLAGCGNFTGPLHGAAAVVVPVRLPGGNDFDIGRLSQNFMLAAWARGVGSCPVTFHHAGCAERVLGVPPEHRAGWGIALGYPDEPAEAELRSSLGSMLPRRGRKPLRELVHRDRWGGLTPG